MFSTTRIRWESGDSCVGVRAKTGEYLGGGPVPQFTSSGDEQGVQVRRPTAEIMVGLVGMEGSGKGAHDPGVRVDPSKDGKLIPISQE